MARHRLAWASIGALRNSQSTLLQFTVELSKKLDIWYSKPPMPVNLKFLDDYVAAADGRGVDGRPRSRAGPSLPGNQPPTTPSDTYQDDVELSNSLIKHNATTSADGSDNLSFSAALRGLQESFAPPATD